MAETKPRVWYNAGYSETRNAIRLVNASGQFTTFASHDRGDSAMLTDADHAFLEPGFDRSTAAGDDAYVDWCLAFVRANAIEIFVVQRGRSAIARRRDDFAALGCKALLTADADTLERIEDKGSFYKACEAAGIPTPAAIAIDDLAGFDDALSQLSRAGMAACIKPPRGVFGSGYFRLDDQRSAFDQLMTIDNRSLPTWVVRQAIAERGGRIPELLVMQHLPGTEWSVDCLCDDGRILAGFVRAKRRHSQLISDDPLLMQLAAQVAGIFKVSNIVNIQFKSATPDGQSPHVLEINPRMSGGCAAGALAGVNLPLLQLMHAAGMTIDNPPPIIRPTVVTSASAMIPVSGSVQSSMAAAGH